MILHNKYSREELMRRLENETFRRVTLSFYRYVILENLQELRDSLYRDWEGFGVLGRIYIAREGINAQISVPEHNLDKFRKNLDSHKAFTDMPFKIAVEDDGKSFLKLILKIKKKIVADGLEDGSFDVTNVGKHLNAEEFNQALENRDSVVVDMRNHYESEVGHFEGAICPEADTFRDELPMVLDLLQDKKDKKILLYCTGGIRCEKASAFLKHHGFRDVNQLYGGIIYYSHEIKEKNIPSKFKGKNFVFDERLGERITDDILSQCHICGTPSDRHINCKNDACHILFIECEKCSETLNGCCSENCKEMLSWPEEKRLEEKRKSASFHKHHSKIRPRLSDRVSSC
jgi:UPF0176 protein